jgi:hypothetical protein
VIHPFWSRSTGRIERKCKWRGDVSTRRLR